MTDMHTYTRQLPRLISRAQTHIHFGGRLSLALSGAFSLHTRTSSCLLEVWLKKTTYADTHPYLRFIACTNTHTPRGAFIFHSYRIVFLTCMRHYTQLDCLFPQYGTSLLRRDCRIADCAVRHLGVRRPFFSLSKWQAAILIHAIRLPVNQLSDVIHLVQSMKLRMFSAIVPAHISFT